MLLRYYDIILGILATQVYAFFICDVYLVKTLTLLPSLSSYLVHSTRIAVITGGSRGIGFGIAQAFSSKGIKCVIVGRDQARLQAAQNALGRDSCIATYSVDVSNAEQVGQLVKVHKHTWKA